MGAVYLPRWKNFIINSVKRLPSRRVIAPVFAGNRLWEAKTVRARRRTMREESKCVIFAASARFLGSDSGLSVHGEEYRRLGAAHMHARRTQRRRRTLYDIRRRSASASSIKINSTKHLACFTFAFYVLFCLKRSTRGGHVRSGTRVLHTAAHTDAQSDAGCARTYGFGNVTDVTPNGDDECTHSERPKRRMRNRQSVRPPRWCAWSARACVRTAAASE